MCSDYSVTYVPGSDLKVLPPGRRRSQQEKSTHRAWVFHFFSRPPAPLDLLNKHYIQPWLPATGLITYPFSRP